MSHPRHLIDMSNPPAPRPRASERLIRVQQFVMSTLAVTTILHFAAGLVVAVWFMDESRVVSRVGLLVIAGILGICSVVAGLAIHRKNVFTPWLVVGVLPVIAAAYFTLGR
jgi:hypothetical protein